MSPDSPVRDWNHVVAASDVPDSGVELSIEADENQRAAVAKRLGVVGVDHLAFAGMAKPWRRGGLQLDGRVSARIRQSCVVTLDPVDESVEESFRVRFLPEHEAVRKVQPDEIVIDSLEDEDPPEPMTGETVDIAQVALEHLALAINPYPRTKGVRLEDQLPLRDGGDADDVERSGAFDVLRDLKSDAGEA